MSFEERLLIDIEDSNDLSFNYNSLEPEFITGLIDGDGSFFVSLSTLGTIKNRIKPGLDICSDSKLLLKGVKFKLGDVGTVSPDKSIFKLRIRGFKQIVEKIIPFMINQKLHTEKKDHFYKWLEACKLLNSEKDLTSERFNYLIDLVYDMNKLGKRRKYTKDEFLEKLKIK